MKKNIIIFLVFVSTLSFSQTTITLQPNSEECNDARVDSLGIWTSGNSMLFKADAWTWNGTNGKERSFMEFDLSIIPEDAIISNAKLSLFDPNLPDPNNYHSVLSSSNSCVLQRITSSWDENTITWQNQPSSTNINEVTLPEITQDHQDLTNIDVTQLLKDIIDSSGYGFLIKLKTEQKYRAMAFASSDHPDSTKHPKLEITYSFPATECIIADFPFNQNANDVSGNSNNGIVHGATLTNDRFGNENSAYYFDGIDDYINIIPSSNVDSINDFTLCVWAKLDDWNIQTPIAGMLDRQYIFDAATGDSTITSDYYREGFRIMYDYTIDNKENLHNTIIYNGTNVTNNYLAVKKELDIKNKWHFIVWMREGDQDKTFIDGVQVNTSYISDDRRDSSLNMQHSWYIGTTLGNNPNYNNINYNFHGKIDDIKIYRCALSDDEIEDLYQPTNDCSSVNISIPNVNAGLNSTVNVSVFSSEIDSSCNIISYSFKLDYDTTFLTYKGYSKTETFAEDNIFMINEVSLGELQIACISDYTPFSGSGSLIDLKFETKECGTTSSLELSNFIFNDILNPNIENGSIYTSCFNYGDVNANGSVTSFDAALLLQNVVGNSTETWGISMPWESWRNFISDVDAIQGLSANDAVNILEYSLDLIPSFPIENNKSQNSINTDISIVKENGDFIFYSNGDLKAFELLEIVTSDELTFGNVEKLFNNGLFAQNSENQYKLSIISTNPIGKNIKLIKLSTNRNNISVTFKTRVNGFEKNYTFNSLENESIENNEVMVFPNPAKQLIIVKNMNGYEINEIFIYDISGKLMLHEAVNSNKKEINISNLPQAVYFINIKTENSTIIKKFIKQ